MANLSNVLDELRSFFGGGQKPNVTNAINTMPQPQAAPRPQPVTPQPAPQGPSFGQSLENAFGIGNAGHGGIYDFLQSHGVVPSQAQQQAQQQFWASPQGQLADHNVKALQGIAPSIATGLLAPEIKIPEAIANAGPATRLIGSGVVRGAENAGVNAVNNLTSGTSLKDTVKQIPKDVGIGALFNTALSPVLTSQAIKQVAGGQFDQAANQAEKGVVSLASNVGKPNLFETGGKLPSTEPPQAANAFQEHAKTSPDLSSEAQAQITAGSHDTRNTVALGQRADALVAQNPAAAMQLALEGKSDASTAAAISFVKKYASEASALKQQGNTEGANAAYAQMAQMVDQHAKNAIEAGRTVQANTLLASLSPEGRVAYAGRQLQKNGMSLAPEAAQAIHQQALSVEAMPDGRDKDLAQQKLNESIAKLIPSSIGDKAFALFRTGLLTGLRTPGKVGLSNAVGLGVESLKNVPAAIADMGASLFTGQRSLVATPKGLGEGGWKGTLAAVDNFVHGYNTPGSGGGAGKEVTGKVNFGDGLGGKMAQAYVDVIGRLHSSLYKPFYGAQQLNSLSDMALTNARNLGLNGSEKESYVTNFIKAATEAGVKGVQSDKFAPITTPEGAAARAQHEAEFTTNQNKTLIGNIASGGTQRGGNTARTILPFTQIPSAIASKILDYSPVGPVAEVINQAVKGNGFDQRTISQAIGRGVVGTGVIALGAGLAKNNLITGAYPTDKKTQDLWATEGKIADAYKGTDGKWHTLASLGAAGNALAEGAGYQAGLQGNKKTVGSVFNASAGALAAGGSVVANSPYLQSANNITNALKTPGSYGLKAAEGFASSVVPQGIANVASATDPLQRQTNGVGDAITNKIPGLREQNLPKIGIDGQPIPRANDVMGSLFDPTYASEPRTSPVLTELDRLNATGNSANPANLTKDQNFNGHKVVLDPNQLTALQQTSGQNINQAFSQVMNTPQYQQASDEQKAAALNNIVTQVRDQTKLNTVEKGGTSSLNASNPSTLSDPNKIIGTNATDSSGTTVTNITDNAQLALAKDLFKKSGQSTINIGNTILRLGTNGTVTAQDANAYKNQLYTAQLDQAKLQGNVNAYLATANQQLQTIQAQLNNPATDPLEALRLQNQAQTLVNNVATYQSQGGFKKGSSGRTKVNAPPAMSVRKPSGMRLSAQPKRLVIHAPKKATGKTKAQVARLIITNPKKG